MKRVLCFWLSVAMVGCTSISDIPPEVDVITPPMQGTVQDGVYHGLADRFRVTLPGRFDDAEFRLVLKEEFKKDLSLVTFIPERNVAERYYVYFEDFAAEGHAKPTLDALADSSLRFFGRDITEATLEPLVFVKQEAWKARYTTGLVRLYTEKVPSTFGAINLKLSEDYVAYHLMYVTVEGGKLAVLWVEWPESCSFCRPLPTDPSQTGSTDPIRAALAADLRVQGFIDSIAFDTAHLASPGR